MAQSNNMAKLKMAKNVVKLLETDIKEDFRNSNIPALMSMASGFSLQVSFTQMEMFDHILAPAVMNMFSKTIKDHIVDLAVCQVLDALHTENGLVGVWNRYTLYTLGTNLLTVYKDEKSGELYLLISNSTDKEHIDVRKIPNDSKMKYKEYSMLGFYMVFFSLQNVLLANILNYTNKKLPKEYLRTKDLPLTTKLANEFAELMRTEFSNLKIDFPDQYCNAEYDPKKADDFIEQFNSGMTKLIARYLASSGLSTEAITQAIANSKITAKMIIFVGQQPTNLGATPFSVTLSSDNLTMVPMVNVVFTTNIRDVVNFLCVNYKVPVSNVEDLGRRIRQFIAELVGYVINVEYYKVRCELEGKPWVKQPLSEE